MEVRERAFSPTQAVNYSTDSSGAQSQPEESEEDNVHSSENNEASKPDHSNGDVPVGIVDNNGNLVIMDYEGQQVVVDDNKVSFENGNNQSVVVDMNMGSKQINENSSYGLEYAEVGLDEDIDTSDTNHRSIMFPIMVGLVVIICVGAGIFFLKRKIAGMGLNNDR